MLCLAFCGSPVLAAPDLPVYRITVVAEPAQHRLTVDSEITLPAAAESRDAFDFALRADMGTPSVAIVAPARLAGDVQVAAVGKLDGANRSWRIRTAAPLAAGEALALRIRHAGGGETTLNHHVGPDAIFVGGGTSAWYPQFGGARATGRLSVAVPDQFSVVATAARAGDEVAGGRRTTTFVTEWPTHFSFTAARYVVEHFDGPRPVTLYLLERRAFAPALAAVALRSLDVLTKEFGPYPFRDFSIVEIPSQAGQQSGFLGAAYDGYIQMRSDYLDAKRADPHFFGHEIGHQWWGVSVEKTGAGGEYMLDEALANFGGLRVIEAMLGADAARRFRAGEGSADGAEDALRLIAAGYDKPLADLPTAPEYYALSDSKGYLFYDMLARLVTAGRLRAMLREVSQRHAHSSISWDAFLAALRAAAGEENRWFLDQWLDRPGLPIVSVRWTQRGRTLTIDVRQREPAYRLDMPVRIVGSDGRSIMTRIGLAGARTVKAVTVSGAVRDVVLDPDRTLLFASPEQAGQAVALRYATRGRLLWNGGRTDEAEKVFREGLAAKPDQWSPAEFTERFYLGWIAQEAGRTRDAVALYEQTLALKARATDLLAQAYLNLARASAVLGDKARTRSAALSAIAAERSAGTSTRIGDAARRMLSPQ